MASWRCRKNNSSTKQLLVSAVAAVALGCLYTPAEAGLYGSSSPVKVLNAAEFKDKVLNSHDLHLVEFYADW